MSKWGKNYKEKQEFKDRFGLFRDAKNYIDAHNSKPSNYKLGINFFADLTDNEKS